jgi:integrase
MRRREPPRVLGPYFERKRWRIVVVEHGTRKSVFVPTEEEARRLKVQFEKEITGPPLRTVGEVIEAFLTERAASGDWRPISAVTTRDKLVAFFASVRELDISQITARRAAALYRVATETTTRYGRPAAVATHRAQLRLAKHFLRWAMKRGLVASNPFAEVEPIGRMNVGKPQLRLDEARAFADTALRMWTEKRDVLALAAVCALFMGLRVSEILGRTVRDLDAGGVVLVIEEGKTKNATRAPAVPSVLRPHLLELARGRKPEELLFAGEGNKRRRNPVLHRKVGRICVAAGVPVVCTHALRGCNASFALEAGVTSEAVARSLGHGSFAVTRRHYTRADAIGNAQSVALTNMLTRPPLADVLSESSAEEIFSALTSDVLAKLVTLYASQQRQ